MVGLVHVIKVNNRPDRIYNLLLDYDLYPEVMPEIKQVSVLSQNRLYDTVEFTGRLIKSVRSTLRLRKLQNRGINWRQVEGDFISNQGSWRLRPIGGAITEVKFILMVDMGKFVPKFVIQKAIAFSIPRMLNRFKKEAEVISA